MGVFGPPDWALKECAQFILQCVREANFEGRIKIVDYRNIILEQADRFHLNAASGWAGLGDFDSALAELEQISAPMQEHPEVLMAQIEIFEAGKNWNSLLPVAEKVLQQLPNLQ